MTLPSSFSGVLTAVHSEKVSYDVVVRGVTRVGTLFGSSCRDLVNGYSRFLCLNKGRGRKRGCISRLLKGRALSAGACKRAGKHDNDCSIGCRRAKERLLAPSRVQLLSGHGTVLFVHKRHPVVSSGCSLGGRIGFECARSNNTSPCSCTGAPLTRSSLGVSVGELSSCRLLSARSVLNR